MLDAADFEDVVEFVVELYHVTTTANQVRRFIIKH